MRNARRVVAVAVVCGVTVFAACVTELQLSQTESKSLVLNGTSPYDFGTLQLGQMSGKQLFSFTSQMTSDDDTIYSVQLMGACNQFDVQGPPPLGSAGTWRVWCEALAFGTNNPPTTCTQHTYDFTASFHPTIGGLSTCDVVFTYMPTAGGTANKITVQLRGTGAAPTVSIDAQPQQVPFGDVQINTTSSAPVTVTNTGSTAVTVSITPSAGPPISITPTTAQTLSGNGSNATYMVKCAPTVADGPHTNTFTFTGMGSAGTATTSTVVSCNAINSALSISSPAQFAEAFLGTPPPDVDVTLSIPGVSGSAMINSYALDQAAMMNGVSIGNNAPSTPFTVTSGNPVTVPLHYKADAPHTGQLGMLSFQTSTGPRNVPILGDALPADVATNPPNLDFGTLCIGNQVVQPVEIYASDVKDFKLTTLTPPASGQFTVTPPNVMGQLLRGNHGNSVTLMVTANPTAVGSASDKITIGTEIPNKPPVDIGLHLNALTAGVGASPDMVHFGALMTDTTSSGKDVVFTNCGSAALDLTAHIDGSNAGDFTIVKTDPASGHLAPTENVTYTLVMTPHGRGARTATLVIDHAGGPTMVPVDGTGVGAVGPGGNVDRETYYACSAGGAAGGLPIGLALLALRRRRRSK